MIGANPAAVQRGEFEHGNSPLGTGQHGCGTVGCAWDSLGFPKRGDYASTGTWLSYAYLPAVLIMLLEFTIRLSPQPPTPVAEPSTLAGMTTALLAVWGLAGWRRLRA